jgi:hypothetical protein
MSSRVLFLMLIVSIFLLNSVYAQTIEISGIQIALIEGARHMHSSEAETIQGKVATYIVKKPLTEVIEFYKLFFKENDFRLIGGFDEEGFNASVRKGNLMFTLRVYSKNKKTILQFIW